VKGKGFVVAIDGPAGSGKSTTARLCAQRLGFFYLDTGAMYRAITLKVLKSGVDIRNGRALKRLLNSTKVDVVWCRGKLQVTLDGRDVSESIRSPEVSGLVSEVSAIKAVREMMVEEQRRLAKGKNVVCEGRDIGSVVFPEAQLKVFLDCDLEERVKRRKKELNGGGRTRIGMGVVKNNLLKRDRIDSQRRISPLRRVPEAILIDTTHLTVEEQVAVVCALAQQRLAGR
jgi:cytidylate kinase